MNKKTTIILIGFGVVIALSLIYYSINGIIDTFNTLLEPIKDK